MSNGLLLALDQGTQSARAMVFDSRGQLVARCRQPIEIHRPGPPGQAEQHANYYRDQLAQACRELWQENDALRPHIRAVALTCQRASVVCLDADMRPVRPAIMWLDQRRTDHFPALPWWVRAPAAVLGQGATLRHFQATAECNWLAAEEPQVWARTRYYMLLSGYLNWWLCGQYRDCSAAQVGYLPFDFKQQKWARAGHYYWRGLTVQREQLPELVPPGGLLGTISTAASGETGIPAGLPLIACGADKACEVLGSGVLTPAVGHLSYATNATFNTCNSRFVAPRPFVPAYGAALPGHYNSEVGVQRGYWLVDWFKREFAGEEERLACERGLATEVLLDDLLETSPPGAQGLVLQPYWQPGTGHPGAAAKGTIIGFGGAHGRAHLYRAIIEGIAFALRDGKERLERRNRVPIRQLVVSGGGSQSDAIMAITADLFGMPVTRSHTPETSGLGAAINAAVGIGLYPDHATAVAAMTRPGRAFEPDPVNQALYEHLFQRVYRRLYRRLSPLYRELRSISGYPPP